MALTRFADEIVALKGDLDLPKTSRSFFPLSPADEELDELACRAFNPYDMVAVTLPCGAVARVSATISAEALAALDRLMACAARQWEAQQESSTQLARL